MDLIDTPKKKDDLETEELESELLVYNSNSEEVVNLNGTGAFIWSLCDGERTLGEIADYLAEQAEHASQSQVETDVLEFARDMADKELIERPGGGDRE